MTDTIMWQPATRYHDLKLDFDQTRRFLEYLQPGAVESKTKFVFARLVYVLDAKGKLASRCIQDHHTFEEYMKSAKKAQDHGWNYFVCINETRGGRRRAEDVTKVRAHFLDFDEEPLELPLLMMPDMVVRSKRGQHWYWHCGKQDNTSVWRTVQRRMIAKFGGDPTCCDLPRIMRLPGAYHLKDLHAPYLVNIEAHTPQINPVGFMSAHLATKYNLDATPDPADLIQKQSVNPSDLSTLPLHLLELFHLFSLRGERPTPVKDGWLFCCPHHGDKNPSLLVRLTTEGDVTLHCRSRKCESDDILHALNIGWGIKYPLGKKFGSKEHKDQADTR